MTASQYLVKQSLHESSTSSSVTSYSYFPIEPSKSNVGETTTSACVGSPGAQDKLSSVVNLGSGAGASGYVGKTSEISWIQRCREILHRKSPVGATISQRDLDLHSLRAQDLNYHMDDTVLLSVDEDRVEVLGWPSSKSATALSQAFFDSLHCVFPFIDRDQYYDAMQRFPCGRPGLSWDERRWLSMANLVFGLGSKWLYLAESETECGSQDHLMYYARARALGLDHRLLFDHPTLEQVQALGLLALYLFVNNSIARSVELCLLLLYLQITSARAWTILGHAMRHATALGLQLSVTARSISSTQKETRSRTWYALYSLEITLAEYTGRPCSVATLDMSVPLDAMRENIEFSPDRQTQLLVDGIEPEPAYQAQSFAHSGRHTHFSHFPCRVRLSILSHRICSSIYSVGGNMSWSDVQDSIRQFNIELQQWQSNLPPELTILQTQPSIASADPGTELAMYFWSVRMILYRPCLCDMEGRIENESEVSREFNKSAAVACIEAALAMLRLMPDSPKIGEAYRILPWWSLLHYVCQAAAVLIMELCLAGQHCPSQLGEILDGLRKAMLYLCMMSKASISAFKAWRVCRQTMTVAASRLGIENDHNNAVSPPAGWTSMYETTLNNALDSTEDQTLA